MSTLEERTRLVEKHYRSIADTLQTLDERRQQFFAPAGLSGLSPDDTQRFLDSDLYSPQLRALVQRVLAYDQADLAARQRRSKEALAANKAGHRSIKHPHNMV